MRKTPIALATLLALLVAMVGYAQSPATHESSGAPVAQSRGGETQPPVIYQTAELTSNDGGPGFEFGYGVSVWGNTVLAGALNWYGAYLFVRPETGWVNMTETGFLKPPTGDVITGVDLSDDDAVVTGWECAGTAYVFPEPPTGWASIYQAAELTASDGEKLCSAAISGRMVVAGAPYAQNGAGAAYVFVEPATGWANMTETAILTSTDGATNPGFGSSVAISGNTVVAGAVGSESSSGAAYIFVEPPGGWADMTQTAELTPSDGIPDEAFGNAVGISGNTVIVGAPNDEFNRNYWQGALYVFVEPESGWTSMTQTAKLLASDGGRGDQLGASAAISGDWIVGGAPQDQSFARGAGKAYLFHKPATGWKNMAETVELQPSDGFTCSSFGAFSSINGGTAVVGAPNICNEASGAAYVFTPAQ